jgi:hypothetical protein
MVAVEARNYTIWGAGGGNWGRWPCRGPTNSYNPRERANWFVVAPIG